MNKKLTISECLIGMEKTIKNAKRLYNDGKLLERAKSPTSRFIYAIAIEELSKAYNLGIAVIKLLEGDEINWSIFWQEFRDHRFKQTGLIRMILVGQNLLKEKFHQIKNKKPNLLRNYNSPKDVEKTIMEFQKTIDEIKKGKLEKIKWSNIYTDYIDNQWKIPNNQLEKDIFIKENIKTYLLDLNTMKNQIEKAIKKRE